MRKIRRTPLLLNMLAWGLASPAAAVALPQTALTAEALHSAVDTTTQATDASRDSAQVVEQGVVLENLVIDVPTLELTVLSSGFLREEAPLAVAPLRATPVPAPMQSLTVSVRSERSSTAQVVSKPAAKLMAVASVPTSTPLVAAPVRKPAQQAQISRPASGATAVAAAKAQRRSTPLLAQPIQVPIVVPQVQASVEAYTQAQFKVDRKAIARQQAASRPVAAVRSVGRSVAARATAYNSLAAQTDNTPNITATGTRTRPGVVALSRDLLRTFPYHSRVRLTDGAGNPLFGNRVFMVEDTMAARKRSSIDIWMGSYRDAIRFGARQVRIVAVR